MSGQGGGTSPGFDAHEAKLRALAALAAQVLPDNKAALFDALADAGVHTVVVSFDGCGDDGQIGSVDAFNADSEKVALPKGEFTFKVVSFERPAIEFERRNIDHIIDAMTFDFLSQSHNGWEDNDGSFGKFTFTVADRTITLDFNQRYTDSTNYQHEF